MTGAGRVARRAGVTVQTILRHFGSRDGLFDEAVEFAADLLVVATDVYTWKPLRRDGVLSRDLT